MGNARVANLSETPFCANLPFSLKYLPCLRSKSRFACFPADIETNLTTEEKVKETYWEFSSTTSTCVLVKTSWKSNLSQCCLKSCSNLKSRPLQNRDRLRRVSADQSRGKKKESWNLFWLKFDRKRWQLVLHHWPLTRTARSSWIWPESPFLDRSCIGKDNKRKRIIEF